jgi:Arc/MetJ-type ribon-helix-helix transcriptional regulator
MTTVSVPITSEQEEFIDSYVKRGKAANKAHAIRYAIQRLSEDDAVETVLASERELAEGKGMRGDLRKLALKIR